MQVLLTRHNTAIDQEDLNVLSHGINPENRLVKRASLMLFCVVLVGCTIGAEQSRPKGDRSAMGLNLTVEAEDVVYTGQFSNNGSSPMWCYSNTCVVRVGDDVFVSGVERLPKWKPLNDCRWMLFKRGARKWERLHSDEKGRTREPCPLACLPNDRLLLSANPTLTKPNARGGGPARPEILEFKTADPKAPYRTLLPKWKGRPGFTEHSYRTFSADASRGEVILFQNVGYDGAEWSLLDGEGKWQTGRIRWPRYKKTDVAPYGAKHVRVNYPVVVLRDRAVHFCGAGSYDNWSRVRTWKDLGLGEDPNRKGASGVKGRQRGNRLRRLLYAYTDGIGKKPFSSWIEIDNSFEDGGWLFAGDMHVDEKGTVHLLWTKSPMLPSLRDSLYKDIKRVYRICYATLRRGKIVQRRTLVEAGEGADPGITVDPDQVGRPYVLLNGNRILGDAISTPRFHLTPDGRMFVVYYVNGKRKDGSGLSENRILEIRADGNVSKPITIPLKHPLTQFFTATPRAGCAPSYTLDLLGHRKGGWAPVKGKDFRLWKGTISYARVRCDTKAKR